MVDSVSAAKHRPGNDICSLKALEVHVQESSYRQMLFISIDAALQMT